jgi:WD40 repeat protein
MSFLDTPGTTVLTYTPNGRYIITAGSNSAVRIYTVGDDGEPRTIDEGVEANFGIAATVNFLLFLLGLLNTSRSINTDHDAYFAFCRMIVL